MAYPVVVGAGQAGRDHKRGLWREMIIIRVLQKALTSELKLISESHFSYYVAKPFLLVVLNF